MKDKIFSSRLRWQALSSDKWIHDIVHGNVLEFDHLPVQSGLLRPLIFSSADRIGLDKAVLLSFSRKW